MPAPRTARGSRAGAGGGCAGAPRARARRRDRSARGRPRSRRRPSAAARPDPGRADCAVPPGRARAATRSRTPSPGRRPGRPRSTGGRSDDVHLNPVRRDGNGVSPLRPRIGRHRRVFVGHERAVDRVDQQASVHEEAVELDEPIGPVVGDVGEDGDRPDEVERAALRGSGGRSSLANTEKGELRLASSQAMLGPSMSQPRSSATSASPRKWRSVRPAPQPKSRTRLPANVQSPGSAARIPSCVSRPTSS